MTVNLFTINFSQLACRAAKFLPCLKIIWLFVPQLRRIACLSFMRLGHFSDLDLWPGESWAVDWYSVLHVLTEKVRNWPVKLSPIGRVIASRQKLPPTGVTQFADTDQWQFAALGKFRRVSVINNNITNSSDMGAVIFIYRLRKAPHYTYVFIQKPLQT